MKRLLGWILIFCGLTLLFFVLLCAYSPGQTLLMPPPKVQFFSGSVPVSGGCIGTFSSGTMTPLATFTDNTGLTQNQNPVTLDGNGQAPIWLSSTAVYRIIVYQAPSFPFNCLTGPGPQLYFTDGIVGVGGGSGGGGTSLLSSNNTWTGTNLFNAATTFTSFLVAPKIGPSLSQQHVIPAVASDTFTLNAATQTLTNKTITNPIVTTGTFTSPTLNTPTITNPTINNILVNSQPGTYTGTINNEGVTGTTLNTLTSLTVAETWIKTSAGATGGVFGICVANCSTSGQSVIQQNGLATCVFDGAATNGHYVQISTTTAGNCHDTGASTYPLTGGQVIGIVMNGGATQINLFGPEQQPQTGLTVESALSANVGGFSTASSSCAGGAHTIACTETTLAQAHILRRFTFVVTTGAVGCGTNAVVGVRDVTAAANLTTTTVGGSTGYFDSGALAISMPAGHEFSVGVLTAASGCGTTPVVNGTTMVWQ